MEQITSAPLFSLNVEPITKTHLSEAAKWARFIAIVGFVFLGLMVVFGIFMSMMMQQSYSQLDGIDNEMGGRSAGLMAYFGAGMAIAYIIFAVIFFFPLLYLFRFATRAKAALARNDQEILNSSFQNLKAYFRYIGVIMIVMLALWAIMILFTVIGAAAFS